jgi:hypothetical protein
MLKRAEVSGEEDATGVVAASVITTLAGVDEDTDSTGVDSTTTALLGLGSFLSCLDATSSETVAVTAGVESTEVAAEEVLDVLTILSDYTHISSVFLSSFQYILYMVNLYLFMYKIT